MSTFTSFLYFFHGKSWISRKKTKSFFLYWILSTKRVRQGGDTEQSKGCRRRSKRSLVGLICDWSRRSRGHNWFSQLSKRSCLLRTILDVQFHFGLNEGIKHDCEADSELSFTPSQCHCEQNPNYDIPSLLVKKKEIFFCPEKDNFIPKIRFRWFYIFISK